MENRRGFLKNIVKASGGLVLGFSWLTNFDAQGNIVENLTLEDKEHEFNAYLKIASNGKVSIYSPNPEIGQGIKTAFAMIVAEELDVDWNQVEVLQANLDAKKYDRQVTGGSGAIKHSWERLRIAGATAKRLLMEAAATKWNLNYNTLTCSEGFVINPNGQKLSYGELAIAAGKISVPKDIKLKNKSDFKLIGKAIKSVDNQAVLKGKPLYGIDYKEPGMLHAQLIRPAGFGQKIESFSADKAKEMPGIVDVIKLSNNKIAVIGRSTWEIMQARKTIEVNWIQDKDLESTKMHDELFKKLMNSENAEVKRKDGDVKEAFSKAHKIVEAEYQCPFVPHNSMEPMNFFADVKDGSARLVGPTQVPGSCQSQISKLLNIPLEKVTVDITKIGGAFGRRLNSDFALEAAEVSNLIKKPVKLTWTREDDMTGGIYRPAVRYKFKAALDINGNMTAYYLKGVGMNAGNACRQDNFPAGAVDNYLVENYDYKSDISTGPWRAPITNFLASAEQSFLDEVAKAANQDPIAFRLKLLKKSKENPVGKITYEPDRFIKVIETVAEKAEWNKKKRNIHQGFSVYFSHNSYVAQIAEVKARKGKINLEKITAVTDCGIVINESSAKNQIFGAILDGYGTAMFGALNFENGVPQESNFNTYKLIRFNERPEIEAHFIDNGIDPTGLGEPALPPTGGAVANAIFGAIEKRLYSQPYIKELENMGLT